jgi:hypothetical protein
MVMLSRSVFADEPGRAEFDEGDAAFARGEIAVACESFEKSYEISGIAGALLRWADCEERRGRYALSATLWAKGQERVAADASRRAFVDQRLADALLQTGTIVVIGVEPPTEVLLDGLIVDRPFSVVVDPGSHALVILAAGRPPRSELVQVERGETVRIDAAPPIAVAPRVDPALDKVAPRSELSLPEERPPWLAIGAVALGLGGAGIATFGVTSALVFDACSGDFSRCPASEREHIQTLNVVNGVGLGVGLAGAAVGSLFIGLDLATEATPARVAVQPTGLRLAVAF